MAHAVVAVDQRGRGAALDHLDVRARIDVAALEGAHVAGQAEDAVRVRAGEVGVEHGAGDDAGVRLRQPAGERVGHERAQMRGRDAQILGPGSALRDRDLERELVDDLVPVR